MAVSLEAARDAAYSLRTLTVSELAAELNVDRRQGLAIMREMVTREMVAPTRCKVGRERIYERTKPQGVTAPRAKVAPPEKVVPRQMRDLRAKRAGDATSGRGARTGSTVVNQLLREVQGQGVTTRLRHHKIEYLIDGEVVASSSKTPGASSLKSTRADLRKAGIAA